MGDTRPSVTAEQMAHIEAEACAMGTREERGHFMATMRNWKLTGLAAAVLSACAPSASNPTGGAQVVEVSAGDEGQGATQEANLTTEEIVLREVRAEMPDHAQYVDSEGNFNTREAARAIYQAEGCSPEEAFDRARDMQQEWSRAIIAKGQEVTTRV